MGSLTLPQWMVVLIGVLLLVTLVIVRSLGQWTEQLLKVERSNRLVMQELKVFANRQPDSIPDAINNVAPFCYEEETDPEPPSSEDVA